MGRTSKIEDLERLVALRHTAVEQWGGRHRGGGALGGLSGRVRARPGDVRQAIIALLAE